MLNEISAIDWSALPDADIEAALATVDAFLTRWHDRTTDSMRGDFGQEAVAIALSRRRTLRDPGRFHSFVCTVARRCRANELAHRSRRPALSYDADWRLAEQVIEPEREDTRYAVGGRRVAAEDLASALPAVLARLTSLNARILISYYEGFTCAELAVRYGLTPDAVKVRVHRSRGRVKRLLAASVTRCCDQACGTCACTPQNQETDPSPKENDA